MVKETLNLGQEFTLKTTLSMGNQWKIARYFGAFDTLTADAPRSGWFMRIRQLDHKARMKHNHLKHFENVRFEIDLREFREGQFQDFGYDLRLDPHGNIMDILRFPHNSSDEDDPTMWANLHEDSDKEIEPEHLKEGILLIERLRQEISGRLEDLPLTDKYVQMYLNRNKDNELSR